MKALTGIILAGGQGKRLGKDKAFIKIGGKPVIVRVLYALIGLCEDIIISANDVDTFSDLPGRVVTDEVPGGGALVGLYSSLKAAETEHAFVCACDMPFLSRNLIEHMMDRPTGYDALIPCHGGYIEPLHAIYSKNCLDAIKRRIDKGRRQIRSFFDDINVTYIPEEMVNAFSPSGLSFFNINTHEDLDKAVMIHSSRLAMKK